MASTYATHIWSQTLYRTTYGFTYPPGDSGYEVSYWNSGQDAAYPYNPSTMIGNFYQVGILNYDSGAHQIFIQTTIPSSDQHGGTYMYCGAGYGFTLGIGALGQQNAGCYANADNLLTPNNYEYLEIYTSNDCAYGSQGCIYGCNGNTRFAIAGLEIGHFADCSNYSGMTAVTLFVLEPSSQGDSRQLPQLQW